MDDSLTASQRTRWVGAIPPVGEVETAEIGPPPRPHLPVRIGIGHRLGLDDGVRITGPTRGSFGGITLAINVETQEAVEAGLSEAVVAGGTLLKPGTELPMGYGGYFADPDGHAWEICCNRDFLRLVGSTD